MDLMNAMIAAKLAGGSGGGGGGGSAENAVLYTAQSLTKAQQEQARTNIGAVSGSVMGVVYNRLDALEVSEVTVSGTTPSIAAADNTIYKCGELESLTISSFPASGKFIIWFTSGATPTTTVGIANFAAEANKVYRITVEDGYATYDAWSMI